MRSTLVIGAIAVAAITMYAGTPAHKAAGFTGPIALKCDRACLENLVDRYLVALVAHDPKRLPLSRDAIYKELSTFTDQYRPRIRTTHERKGYHAPFQEDRAINNDSAGFACSNVCSDCSRV